MSNGIKLTRGEEIATDAFLKKEALTNLQKAMLRLYGEIVQSDEASAAERLDALSHIALLSGAIDSFKDRNGIEHRRVSDRRMLQVFQMIRWENEDGLDYLGDGFAASAVAGVRAAYAECRRLDPLPPLTSGPVKINLNCIGSGVGKGARSRRGW